MRRLFPLLVWVALLVQPVSARAPITRIPDIRALTPAAAASGLPVRIRGVVTFSNERIRTLFIHDGRNGIYVDRNKFSSPTWPEEGDRVEITGITGHGVFSPVICLDDDAGGALRIIASGPLPPPRTVDGTELSRPRADCDWVSVDADVTELVMDGEDLVITCRAGAYDFHVLLVGPLPAVHGLLWDLADRRVRIRGVVATVFNSNGQMTRRFLRVASHHDIVQISPSDPSRPAPRVGSSQLFRLDGPGPGDQVKVQGVVTFDMPGRGLFLRTDGGGLWVQNARGPKTHPGQVVEVEGRPRAGDLRPFVRAFSVEVIDSQSPPKPVQRRAEDLLDARFDSELVAIDSEVLNFFRGAEGTTLELKAGTLVFRAVLDKANGVPRVIHPGSKVRLTGIAQISAISQYWPLQVEEKLLLRLRSPGDITLLRPPPWWTPQRVALAYASVFALLLAVYVRARLRRRRRQEAQRRTFEAVLAERGRFAREIHDSLAQGLTSISLQLECVRSNIGSAPETAAGHLEAARELVRDSMREARRTIWNLRPLALGEADLASALQKHAADLTRDNGISCQQQIEGTPRPVPHEPENALLRIGQESLTNAVRHASPRRIGVRLRFGDGWVTLVVKDDGCGFDVANRAGKGYGLTGMRERVEALGGSLSIDSRIGDGTEVSVTFPT